MAAAPKQDNKSKKVLRYPQSIIAEQTDYLQMTVISYKPIGKPIVSKPGNRRNANEARIRTIILPIPSNISDTNAARFGAFISDLCTKFNPSALVIYDNAPCHNIQEANYNITLRRLPP